MNEADVRFQIDRLLEKSGWLLDQKHVDRNVYFEGAVKAHMQFRSVDRLGLLRPDYTLFDEGMPIAVIEAKKSNKTKLTDALDQARRYAERIGDLEILFACNGFMVKSEHITTGLPLYLDGKEVMEFLPLKILRKFHVNRTHEVFTVSEEIVRNRDVLISLFSGLNGDLRAEGIRAGIERFTEFANFLFLKLLSEKGEIQKWDELVRLSGDSVIGHLNKVVVPKLREQYGGEVTSEITIKNPKTVKKIMATLNNLQLTSIDEDVKGLAFEHFIQKTTDTQNDLGEYFTPRHIVRFMVKLLNPKYSQNVYDPFCGTGGFLTESFKHISQNSKISYDASQILQQKTIYGGEITTTSRIAKMNMILFGDGHSGVEKQDSLRVDSEEKYDNVITNVPFSLELEQEVLDMVGANVKDSDQACVLKSFNSLKTGGSMAVVVPEGFLVNKVHKEFFRYLLDRSNVRMVIRLPRGCFAPYTDAKTGIIYLTDKLASRTEWFYTVNVLNDGYDKNRNPIGGVSDLDEILFFFSDNESPIEVSSLPSNLEVGVVSVCNLSSLNSQRKKMI